MLHATLYKRFENNKDVLNYKHISNSYQTALRKNKEYRLARDKYFKKTDEVTRKALARLEKKYGKYADLERKQDNKKMDAFSKEYHKELKNKGIYTEKNNLENMRQNAKAARDIAEKETQVFVSNWLGKYGDMKLKGQGSAIYKGNKLVDHVRSKDIVTKAIMYDIDQPHFSMDKKR